MLLLAAALSSGCAPPAQPVLLRSGPVLPGAPTAAGQRRWVLRLEGPPGAAARRSIEAAGIRLEAPLPGGWLVTAAPAALDAVDGLAWRAPYLPAMKLAPEIQRVRPEDEGAVIAVLHLFSDADPAAFAEALRAAGVPVAGAGVTPREGRVVLALPPARVAALRDGWAADERVSWVSRRPRRELLNDAGVWVAQSGTGGGEATPIFEAGLRGEGQIAAVLDTGVDIDSCYFRDGAPAINRGLDEVEVALDERVVAAVDFLWDEDDPDDPTDWDDHSHGTHVAGIVAGDHSDTPDAHDRVDGMAPAARLIIQDGGYTHSVCADLPALGCPTVDLNPVFEQAWRQGARVHTNSWGENGEDLVANVYTDAGQDADGFMWDHPEMLLVFGAGNNGPRRASVISPAAAKNVLAVGATGRGAEADYLASFSSRGPVEDGRIKPDLVFPGVDTRSAYSDLDIETDACLEVSYSGTSMAAPGAAGAALLVRQYYAEGFYPTGSPAPEDGFSATGALVKATLTHSAASIPGAEAIPSNEQGWGRVQLDRALLFAGGARRLLVDDRAGGFTDPADPPAIYAPEVLSGDAPLKVTLVWTDYPATPGAATHLVNDLDLAVEGPDGATYLGNVFDAGASVDGGDPDRLNPTEQVLIEAPAPGTWSVTVSAVGVPVGPQDFALVISGDLAPPPAPPEDTGGVDSDPGDPEPVDSAPDDSDPPPAVDSDPPPTGDSAPTEDSGGVELAGGKSCGCGGGAGASPWLLAALAGLARRRRGRIG